nr:transcription factor GTE7-like [Ipomoea batatas]
MASAALASRNELSWAQSCAAGGGFMGKTPNSRPHLKPSANSNPKKKQKYLHHGVNGRQNDDLHAVKQTASDDAYSFNQPPKESNGLNFGSYLTYNVNSYSKAELSELRKRLGAELEQIRNLRDRIESGNFSTSTTNPRPYGKSKKMPGNKEQISVGSDSDLRRFSNKNAGVVCGGIGVIDMENMMKDCRQILTKLMKHKSGWIFNSPVDAAALGLHDYHQIIKRPMDLGTVKSNMGKNWYPSPVEFAADVRLTFNNALLYNPKTDQVHGWAGLLLARFEELFKPIQDKLLKVENERKEILGVDEFHGSHWNHISTPEIAKKPKPSPIPQAPKKQEILHSQSSASTPSVPPPPSNPPLRKQSPIPAPSPMTAPTAKPIPVRGGTTGKQPKPRAKDPNKREMSMEEKHKLGVGLQSLPQEKMPQLVQIIRKRNEHLAQDDDEIELDIEALDTETLWELDRFVTNWKKMVSKTKRQALIGNLTAPTAAPTTSNTEVDEVTTHKDAVFENNDSTQKPKRIEVGDEDVDIDDDMPAASFPPVEIEKDEAAGREPDNRSSSSSSSGSSGSDSSSSSGNIGSDSGSSSGSDSDADDAQS